MSKVYTSKEGIEVVVKESGEETNHTGGFTASPNDQSNSSSNNQTTNTESSFNTMNNEQQEKKDNTATKILGGIALVLVGGAFGYFMNNQKPVAPDTVKEATTATAPVASVAPATPLPDLNTPSLPTVAVPQTTVPKLPDAKPANIVVVLEEKAKQGDPVALSRLGLMYLQGKEVPKNKDLAIDYLNQASQKNNDVAQYHLGILNLQDKKYADGIQLLEKSQKNGNADAQKFLAKVFDGKTPVATVITKEQHHAPAPQTNHKHSSKGGDEFSRIDKELDHEFKNFEKSLDKEFSKIDRELRSF